MQDVRQAKIIGIETKESERTGQVYLQVELRDEFGNKFYETISSHPAAAWRARQFAEAAEKNRVAIRVREDGRGRSIQFLPPQPRAARVFHLIADMARGVAYEIEARRGKR